MSRVVLLIGVALAAVAVRAADPPDDSKPLTPAEHNALVKQVDAQHDEALKLYQKQDLAGAEALFRRNDELLRRLYPGDNEQRAVNMNNLAVMLTLQRRHIEAEALLREALPMYRRVFKGKDHWFVADNLNSLASVLKDQGRLADAEPVMVECVAMYRRLFSEKDHPKGHPKLADALLNLGRILHDQGRLTDAEPPLREAVAAYQRLYPDADHPRGHRDVARALGSLASVFQHRGNLEEAERLDAEVLAMNRRLYPAAEFPDGHPDLATAVGNLASVREHRDKAAEAEPLYREALAMNRRLYEKRLPNGHPELAIAVSNLAGHLARTGRLAEAEPLAREQLRMWRGLIPKQAFPDGHPHLGTSLNNLANILQMQGKLAEARDLYDESAAMYRRLFPAPEYPNGHPHLLDVLQNQSAVYWELREFAAAERVLREAVETGRRLTAEVTLARPEGDVLNYLANLPPYRDAYLSLTTHVGAAADVYPRVWDAKATVGRAYERRRLTARTASAGPVWDELAALRRRRADTLLAPRPANPATRAKRDEQLQEWGRQIDDLTRKLRDLSPAAGRDQDLAARTPADLLRALPAGAVFVDFVRYLRLAYDPKKPGKAGETRTPSYLAFVVTPSAIERLDLGPAEPIDRNLTLWREALRADGREPPADLPLALRRALWEPVAAKLPAGVATVFISPDGPLAFLPWAALPGRSGDHLLDDHAIALVPSGPALLDRLTAPSRPAAAAGLLAVGNVAFDRAATEPSPAAVAKRGPAAGEGKPLAWSALPGAAAEVGRVAQVAAAAKLPAATLTGTEPSVARLLAELPKYRYVHFATHGFFADPEFRTRLKVDESLFQVSRDERIGAAALSPFLLSGVVCAGANRPDTPSRGLLTAEALIGTDLSALELAVLSACDTGLGDTGGGQGVFGLQTAFHLAGCRNVVASLWKVDDEATAALMALFYRNLWEKQLPPIEALRQAQLGLRRHPELVAGLARGERGRFEEVELPPVKPKDPKTPATAAVRQWAAFTLSGPGR